MIIHFCTALVVQILTKTSDFGIIVEENIRYYKNLNHIL